jgi:hypothetical protein
MVLGMRAVDGEAGRVGVGPGVVETLGAGPAWVETAAWDADAVSLFVGGGGRCLVWVLASCGCCCLRIVG